MKELKFRAWLKDNKKMCQVGMLEFTYKGGVCCDSESTSACRKYFDFEEIELMQYTDINDKNGIEIYDGDIVLINGHKYVVVDEEGIFAKAIEKYQVDFDWETIRRAKKDNFDLGIEVIGNIYENPELLEGD